MKILGDVRFLTVLAVGLFLGKWYSASGNRECQLTVASQQGTLLVTEKIS